MRCLRIAQIYDLDNDIPAAVTGSPTGALHTRAVNPSGTVILDQTATGGGQLTTNGLLQSILETQTNILVQVRIMNTHLAIVNSEVITKDDLEEK